MIIANPFYYSVFKYLMADTDIAREMLPIILSEEIQHLEANLQERFIKILRDAKAEILHNYLIQAHHLPLEPKTKLERISHIFNPKFRTHDKHKIDFTDTIDEPIVQKILYRLLSALVDDTIRRNMHVEDEVECILKRQTNERAAKIAVQKRLNEEMTNDKTIESDIDQAKERRVRSLINYSSLSDAQIASATNSTLYFVQKHRYDLIQNT